MSMTNSPANQADGRYKIMIENVPAIHQATKSTDVAADVPLRSTANRRQRMTCSSPYMSIVFSLCGVTAIAVMLLVKSQRRESATLRLAFADDLSRSASIRIPKNPMTGVACPCTTPPRKEIPLEGGCTLREKRLLLVSPDDMGAPLVMQRLQQVLPLYGFTLNSQTDTDGLRHVPYLNHTACPIECFGADYALYLFSDPLQTVRSFFSRNVHILQYRKLHGRHGVHQAKAPPVPLTERLEEEEFLRDDAAYLAAVVASGEDAFGLLPHMAAWLNAQMSFPILFLETDALLRGESNLHEFLHLSKDALPFSSATARSRTEYPKPPLRAVLVYDAIFATMQEFHGYILPAVANP